MTLRVWPLNTSGMQAEKREWMSSPVETTSWQPEWPPFCIAMSFLLLMRMSCLSCIWFLWTGGKLQDFLTFFHQLPVSFLSVPFVGWMINKEFTLDSVHPENYKQYRFHSLSISLRIWTPNRWEDVDHTPHTQQNDKRKKQPLKVWSSPLVF